MKKSIPTGVLFLRLSFGFALLHICLAYISHGTESQDAGSGFHRTHKHAKERHSAPRLSREFGRRRGQDRKPAGDAE